MKSFLKFTSLFSAAAVPTSLAIEAAGVSLPPIVEAPAAVGAFAISVILLTVWSDYSRQPAARARVAPPSRLLRRSRHPLAA